MQKLVTKVYESPMVTNVKAFEIRPITKDDLDFELSWKLEPNEKSNKIMSYSVSVKLKHELLNEVLKNGLNCKEYYFYKSEQYDFRGVRSPQQQDDVRNNARKKIRQHYNGKGGEKFFMQQAVDHYNHWINNRLEEKNKLYKQMTKETLYDETNWEFGDNKAIASEVDRAKELERELKSIKEIIKFEKIKEFKSYLKKNKGKILNTEILPEVYKEIETDLEEGNIFNGNNVLEIKKISNEPLD